MAMQCIVREVMCMPGELQSPAHDAKLSDALRARIRAQCNYYYRSNCSNSDRATITVIVMQIAIITMQRWDDATVTNPAKSDRTTMNTPPSPREAKCVRKELLMDGASNFQQESAQGRALPAASRAVPETGPGTI